MRDLRMQKLADVLVNYSVGVKPGQLVRISGPPISEPLVVELYRQVLAAGGHPTVRMVTEELNEIFLKNANDDQLKFLNPINLFEYEKIDCSIGIWAEENTKAFFLEPRLDVLYRLSDAIALKADGGRFAQMPSLPVSVPGFEAFGLADLGAQTSIGGSVGVETRLPRSFTLGVTGYYETLRLTDVRNIDLQNIQPTEADFLVSRGHDAKLAPLYAQMLVGMVPHNQALGMRFVDEGPGMAIMRRESTR